MVDSDMSIAEACRVLSDNRVYVLDEVTCCMHYLHMNTATLSRWAILLLRLLPLLLLLLLLTYEYCDLTPCYLLLLLIIILTNVTTMTVATATGIST